MRSIGDVRHDGIDVLDGRSEDVSMFEGQQSRWIHASKVRSRWSIARSSCSTARTVAPASSNRSVSTPGPGPTSRTLVPSITCEFQGSLQHSCVRQEVLSKVSVWCMETEERIDVGARRSGHGPTALGSLDADFLSDDLDDLPRRHPR